MAFRSHRRSSFRQPVKKRRFQWAHTNYVQGTAKVTDSIDLLAGVRADLGTMANLPDWTLVRIRGIITFALPSATAPTVNTGTIVGAYVENRFAAPPSNPVDDPYLEWAMFAPVAPGAIGSGYVPGNTGLMFGAVLDNKAMRKLHELDSTLWLSWKAIDGVATYTARGVISCGFKLP